jgi:hypothetical protein
VAAAFDDDSELAEEVTVLEMALDRVMESFLLDDWTASRREACIPQSNCVSQACLIHHMRIKMTVSLSEAITGKLYSVPSATSVGCVN